MVRVYRGGFFKGRKGTLIILFLLAYYADLEKYRRAVFAGIGGHCQRQPSRRV